MSMTRTDIVDQRLRNQRILTAQLEKPVDVVNWLGAVQAQDYAGAKWALGLRMQKATDHEINQAFDAGDILRTHLLRPTWHFVTPADICWLLALTSPRVHAVNTTMYRKLELDQVVFKRSSTALEKALQGGQQLTRIELRDTLQKAGIAAVDGLRLAYIMMQAELDGLICSGARRGKQFTYALLEERAPHAKTLDRDSALAELAGRYFSSRGPASVHDFAKWSGLTTADAGRGLEAVKPLLNQEKTEEQVYWFPEPTPSKIGVTPTAYLLSIYDEYVSGYKDRSAIGEVEIGARLAAMGNALSYIIVVDGQIVGTWKRRLTNGAMLIETNLFTRLTEIQAQAVAEAAVQYGEFLEVRVVLDSE